MTNEDNILFTNFRSIFVKMGEKYLYTFTKVLLQEIFVWDLIKHKLERMIDVWVLSISIENGIFKHNDVVYIRISNSHFLYIVISWRRSNLSFILTWLQQILFLKFSVNNFYFNHFYYDRKFSELILHLYQWIV